MAEDIMFVCNDQPRVAQKSWLELAGQGKLAFKGWQVVKMRFLLGTP